MQQSYTTAAKHYQKQRRWNSNWRKVTTILASVVVFITTYALILPAITMEPEYICGKEAHVHTDACYQLAEPIHMSNLICTFDTLGIHKHTNECYTEDSELICGYADFVLHTHSSHCYDQDGELVCALPELKEHIHDEACWKQPHVHEEVCYTQQQGDLLCAIEEGTTHAHADACFTARQNQICELAAVEPHTHGVDCWTKTTEQICQQEETEGHLHGEGCYDESNALVCLLPEIAGHTHTDDCYQVTETFTCALEETEGHAHGETCFETVLDLTCTLSADIPHIHTGACYSWSPVLSCVQLTAEEGAVPVMVCEEQELYPHTHSSECFAPDSTLICTLLEVTEHNHEDACFVSYMVQPTEPVLICQLEVHEHTEDCVAKEEATDADLSSEETLINGLYCGLVEHEHQDGCFNEEDTLMCTMTEHEHDWICELPPSDDTAVETPDDWEADLPELNGRIADDLIAVAKSQLGYAENEENYILEGEDIYYYNRYSAWWDEDDPYTPWNAKFVSFCLNYADIDFELYEDPASWFEDLQWDDQLLPEDSAPIAADLVFFDLDNDESADRVGIIAKVDNTAGRFGVILERRGLVQQVNYDLDDSDILGFARIPGNVPAVELQSVNSERVQKVIDLIDAMPSYDEVFAQLDVYYEADDAEGEEAYYTAVVQQVGDVYFEYSILTDAEKEQVTNADKLLELEFIWSQTILLDEITSDTPKTVSSVSTKDFITLNLYDYSSNINDKWKNNNKWPGFQWNGGAYMTSYAFSRTRVDNIDFGNSMITDYDYGSSGTSITNGKSSNSKDVVSNDSGRGLINGKGDTYTNTPIGVSTGTDVMAGKLSSGGYPMLKEISSDTLYWLFQDGTYAKKKNTQNIDGLFQKNEETGEYYYDCRDNHAQYGNNKFTLYKQIITPNFIIYPFGNFLPLNDITNGSNATQVSKITNIGTYVQGVINDLVYDDTVDSTRQQLIDMLARYRTNLQNAGYWNSWGATNVIQEYLTAQSYSGSPSTSLLKRLYNIDWDVDTNFFFGMEMRMNFMQPKDGMTGKNNAYPMVFHFAGDDDVWVYIDNTLFLDLSGIHRHVGGDIDFVNGKVHYYKFETYVDGEIQSTPFKTLTFAEILKTYGGIAEADLGKYLKKDASGNYTTFLDYSTHKFDFFYMERGSGSSVCRINFNFPLLRQNSITVTKETSPTDSTTEVLGSPDYYFSVIKRDGSGLVVPVGTAYDILDSGGNTVGSGSVDQYGMFKLKAGQTAVFSVTENIGEYYVQELIPEPYRPQYGENVGVNDYSSQYNKEIEWKTSNRPWAYPALTAAVPGNASNPELGPPLEDGGEGVVWYGFSSNYEDASDSQTFLFRMNNHVAVDNLGSLRIEKQLIKVDDFIQLLALEDPSFNMAVKLDGVKLPVGTAYTVYYSNGTTSNKAVTTAGVVSVPAGGYVLIDNILAGTTYTVTEQNDGLYDITYHYPDETGQTATNKTGASGIVAVDTQVKIQVVNSEVSVKGQLTINKTVVNPDSTARDYSFQIVQVDAENELVANGLNETITMNGITSTGSTSFQLGYAEADIESFPETYYYRITEVNDRDDVLNNTQIFLAEVTVEKVDGKLNAQVINLWSYTIDQGGALKKEAVSGINFRNTIVGSLTLSKTVVGTMPEGGFTFCIKLTDSSGKPVSGSFPATIHQKDGKQLGDTRIFDVNGEDLVENVMDGESITIYDIPYGTTWTIKEINADGYVVTYTVNNGDVQTGAQSTGSIIVGATDVAYTNSVMYELPETGGGGTMVYRLVGSGMLLMPIPILWRKKTRPRGRRGNGN